MGSAALQKTGPVRKHVQLRTAIAVEISQGNHAAGEFLPSEPELARIYAMLRSTVRQALSALEEDGIVARLPGKGTVVVAPADGKKTSSFSAFAIVLPEIQGGHYPALVDGFASAVRELHHQAIVCTTGNQVDRQGNVILQLMDSGVAGVAVVPTTSEEKPVYQFRQLQKQGIPVVFLHRTIDDVSAPVIAIPFEAVIAKAVEALLEKGRRKIAFLGSHRSEAVSRYEQALRSTLHDAGINLPSELVHIGDNVTSEVNEERIQQIKQTLEELMSLPEELRPTAIIDPWDSDMEACYFALTQMGVSVPTEMSLISFGGANRIGPMAKRLTAVTVEEASTSNLAVQLLSEMAQGKRPISDSSRFLVPLGFHTGETLAAASTKSAQNSN